MPDADLLVWPFTAGLLAAFNPCGFAMLPTYLTYFLGLDEDDPSLARSVLRGGKVGLALSGGGFRASLFHLGVLARLAELDAKSIVLPKSFA